MSSNLERIEFVHGFVLFSDLTPPIVHGARGLTEIFSDAPRRAAPNIYYGSLLNTAKWFHDRTHLHQMMHRELSVFCGKSCCVVFSNHFMEGFFYALEQTSTGITYVDCNNISFLRFRRNISWAGWLRSAKTLLQILDLSASERDKASKEIERLAEGFLLLRYAHPSAVPDGFQTSELTRRFGHFAAFLWSSWQQSDGECDNSNFSKALSFRVRDLHFGPNALDFTTRSCECVPDRNSFFLQEISCISLESIFLCLQRISELNLSSIRYGLRDFKVEIIFDERSRFQRNISLVSPLFERNRQSNLLIESVVSLLRCDVRHFRDEEHPEWERSPVSFQEIIIQPLSIFAESVPAIDIFSIRVDKRSLAQVASELSFIDGCKAAVFQEKQGIKSNRNGDILVGGISVFRYQHQFHPPVLLRRPLFVEIGSHPFHEGVFVFAEKIEEAEYFVCFIQKEKIAFWMRTSRKQEKQNPIWELLGVFDHVIEGEMENSLPIQLGRLASCRCKVRR